MRELNEPTEDEIEQRLAEVAQITAGDVKRAIAQSRGKMKELLNPDAPVSPSASSDS